MQQKYNFATTFNEYNSIFERVSTISDNEYDGDCGNFNSQYSKSGNSLFKNCRTSLLYLKELEDNYASGNSKKMAEGLAFIYYWLNENEFNNNNYKGKIIEIYEALLELHNEKDYGMSNIPNTYETQIENKLNVKLIDLYSLYDKLNKLKTCKNCENIDKCKHAEKCVHIFNNYKVECQSDSNTDFCKVLHIFAEQFDGYIINNNTCEKKKVHVLLNKNPHISVILLPIVITLTITFFLLYKVITNFILKCA
ncbi:hypothetical protein PVMG_01440 [Plasmodium vivax Mauritania I]|uniref:Variable surface protein n=1 Tax=Plasmodium vivax Mauritania I TaxID=1035515 RepID=A0A0J9TCP5_PLAVI|nr:hypothetical protein PVMG_01440 [Plasmodium vivax Mauritania I]